MRVLYMNNIKHRTEQFSIVKIWPEMKVWMGIDHSLYCSSCACHVIDRRTEFLNRVWCVSEETISKWQGWLHTYSHIHTHTHTYTHILAPTHTYSHLHTHTRTYTHILAPIHTYSHLHTHTRTYTTHTRTYTYIVAPTEIYRYHAPYLYIQLTPDAAILAVL